jgi:hypothetical protein
MSRQYYVRIPPVSEPDHKLTLNTAVLSKTDFPCMLVACKAEIPEERREVHTRFRDSIRRSFPNVNLAETNKDEAETQKRCLSNMLHRIFATPRGTYLRGLLRPWLGFN